MQSAITDNKNPSLNLSTNSNFRSCGKDSMDVLVTGSKPQKSLNSPGSKTPSQSTREGKGSSFKSPLSSIFKEREIHYLATKDPRAGRTSENSKDKNRSGSMNASER
jgi:hypothetical protein